MATSTTIVPKSLVVFSDDWGRHPSSCQHLVRQLLPDYQVLWVNTIGTRTPRLDLATIKRVGEKIWQWVNSISTGSNSEQVVTHENLTVINPPMWPWFSRKLDRRLNSWILSRHLAPLIEAMPQPVTAITTLPITADLTETLSVKKWLYYYVDDFGVWPGLDGNTLSRMNIKMIQRADEIVAVSEHLQKMVSSLAGSSSLLTHGVDLPHWQSVTMHSVDELEITRGLDGPLAVFWGVVDQRLSSEMIRTLSSQMDGNILLVGPKQDPDPEILALPNVYAPGPLPFDQLPALARKANVLIMPYADLPVTQAIQPLKMKEYMATGCPVVVSNLPAVSEWADCIDVATTPRQFATAVCKRLDGRLPDTQATARERLSVEGWKAKAKILQTALH